MNEMKSGPGIRGRINQALIGLLRSMFGITADSDGVIRSTKPLGFTGVGGNQSLLIGNYAGNGGAKVDGGGGGYLYLGSFSDILFAAEAVPGEKTFRWRIKQTGHFFAEADNGYDIGSLAANRPRDVYVAGWVKQSGNRAVLTADVTNDSAALATTGLTVTLKVGRKYSFLAYLYVSTGAVLEGIQAGLNGTATITNLLADVEVKSHAATPVFTVGRLTAFGTAVGQTVADVGNAQVEISGTIECNAAGTFRIEFAKNSDTGALNTTVRRGSWLLVEDMP